jgi:hypothetical protein
VVGRTRWSAPCLEIHATAAKGNAVSWGALVTAIEDGRNRTRAAERKRHVFFCHVFSFAMSFDKRDRVLMKGIEDVISVSDVA